MFALRGSQDALILRMLRGVGAYLFMGAFGMVMRVSGAGYRRGTGHGGRKRSAQIRGAMQSR